MIEKTVLITGACGSLGAHTSKYLAERFWKVFAVDINQAGFQQFSGINNISTSYVDITEQASIEALYRLLDEQTDGLDGIINFAGFFKPGSMVEISEHTLFKVMNVNVLGTFRVNKTLFPLIYKRRGRIINISSEIGWQSSYPFNGAYAMSKHAIEAYSDSLRRELMFLNIPVIKIQPGPIRSEMVDRLVADFTEVENKSIYFKEILRRAISMVKEETRRVNDRTYVSRAVYIALTTEKPKSAYSVKPELRRTLLEWLPAGLRDRILKKAMGG